MIYRSATGLALVLSLLVGVARADDVDPVARATGRTGSANNPSTRDSRGRTPTISLRS
jgi:hypothetical protein